MKKNIRKPFPYSRCKYPFGVLLILLGLLFAVAPFTKRFLVLSYPLAYLLGLGGVICLGLFLIATGIRLFLKKKGFLSFLRHLGGFATLALGSSLLVGAICFPVQIASPDFDPSFLAHNGMLTLNGVALSGGVLGFALSETFSSFGALFLSYVLAGLILLCSLFLFLLPLFALLLKAKAKAPVVEPEPEEEEDDSLEEVLPPTPVEDEEDGAPDAVFFPSEDKPSSSPIDGYHFEMAGKVPLPKRASIHHPEGEASMPLNLGEEAPRSLPNPDPLSYERNPISNSGLQAAYFDGFPEENPSPSAQTPAPEPVAPTPEFKVEPTPETKPAEPAVLPEDLFPQDEEIPLMETELAPEEEEVVEAPSFETLPTSGPTLASPVPLEEETPEDDWDDEEEEAIPPAPTPAPGPAVEEIDDGIPAAKPLPPYTMPSMDLLDVAKDFDALDAMERECEEKTAIINQTFADFNFGARVVSHVIGPSVTRFNIQPDNNVSVSGIQRLLPDIELRLGGIATRFTERVTGQTTAALEVANSTKRTVIFRELMEVLPTSKKDNLVMPFGEDISGAVRFADLSKFPHMLVAGTTGSGKSVFMNGIIMTLLMRNRPEELKFVLVDPKRVEFSIYKDLPHLLCPIIKEPGEARTCLKKLVEEMDHRYDIFEKAMVTDIRTFNNEYCEEYGKQKMPFIVCFIDEYADLVGQAKDVQDSVLRLGQKARACGIHLVIATQRPDVKVITGTIKSNLPVRVALTVGSSTDSQTILGVGGAEELGGYGDMLVDCSHIARNEFVRIQGCYLTDGEKRRITNFIRSQMGPQYDENFLNLSEDDSSDNFFASAPSNAPLPVDETAMKNASGEEKYQYIKTCVMARETTSISQIQRDYGVGFPRAGKIFARLQAEGIIASNGDAPTNSHGVRVLVHSTDVEPHESILPSDY